MCASFAPPNPGVRAHHTNTQTSSQTKMCPLTGKLPKNCQKEGEVLMLHKLRNLAGGCLVVFSKTGFKGICNQILTCF